MITDYTEYHRLYYYKRRDKMIAYLGVSCAHCGSTDRLEFDHIDPALKSFDISDNMTLNNPEVRAELDKCQLLCRPCHEVKTAAENTGITHGTRTGWMKSGCECDECYTSKRAWHDERNAKRREASGKAQRLPYGRPAEHGAILMYRRGCKCELCKAANTAYAQELKARKTAA